MLSDSNELLRLRHWVKRKASPTLFSGLSANSSTKGPLLADPAIAWLPRGPATSTGSLASQRHSTGGLIPFRPLSGLQETPVATREESGVLCFPWSPAQTPRMRLECNPEIAVAPGEEH